MLPCPRGECYGPAGARGPGAGLRALAPTLARPWLALASPRSPKYHACMTLTAAEVLAELDVLADPRILAVNERHGDDHAVNLTKLRGLAKRAGRDPELARALWASGDTAARLVALLILRPRDVSADELDTMLREARLPKVTDWLVSYLVLPGPHTDELRERWFTDPDPRVAAAGWDLATARVKRGEAGADPARLLDLIEEGILTAPDRLQWAMNTALGEIGITQPEHRARVLDMGERLGVLRDYPTSPGCVSPFVPIWVNEMVRRAGE